jgi:hypothetical protein
LVALLAQLTLQLLAVMLEMFSKLAQLALLLVRLVVA